MNLGLNSHSRFFWGYWSDVKGRRIVLLVGLIGNALSAVAFGFSKWLLWAIVARSIAGLLNGNTGVVKYVIFLKIDFPNKETPF